MYESLPLPTLIIYGLKYLRIQSHMYIRYNNPCIKSYFYTFISRFYRIFPLSGTKVIFVRKSYDIYSY